MLPWSKHNVIKLFFQLCGLQVIRLECQGPYLVRAISRAVDHSFLTLALGSIL